MHNYLYQGKSLILRPLMAQDTTDQSRRQFVKGTATGTAALGLGALAGCTGSSGDEGDGTESGGNGGRASMGSVASLENSYWLSWEKGYEEACDVLGYSTNLQTNGGQVTTQQQQFDTAIANDVNAIIGQTYTDAAAISLAEACVAAEVPTVLAVTIANWYTPQDAGDEYVQFFMPNFVEHAYTAAKVLFEEMGGEGGFVHIEGNRGTSPNAGRNVGVDLALEEYPDIELLGPRIQGNWIRGDSRDAMSDLVSRHGDDIKGFFGQNDAVAIGGTTVLEENDIDVPVVGIGASEPGLERIADGRMVGSVSDMATWQAGMSMVLVHDYLEGYQLDPSERMMVFDGPLVVADDRVDEMRDVLGDDSDLPIFGASGYNEKIFEGETPYDWTAMSRAEAGEDAWDPQIRMTPLRKEELPELLGWKEENRPNGYELPDVFDDSDAMDATEQRYQEQFQNDPLRD